MYNISLLHSNLFTVLSQEFKGGGKQILPVFILLPTCPNMM